MPGSSDDEGGDEEKYSRDEFSDEDENTRVLTKKCMVLLKTREMMKKCLMMKRVTKKGWKFMKIRNNEKEEVSLIPLYVLFKISY